MKYIEAPNYSVEIARLNPSHNLFLAGSITGAENWQKELAHFNVPNARGSDYNRIIDYYNVFNPRRENFDVSNPSVEEEQITWEYHCIHQCEKILFWFAPETLAPITLFELGSALHSHKPEHIYIGIHPDYKRKNDVIIQTALRDKWLSDNIVFSKEELAAKVVHLYSSYKDTFNEH